MPRDKYFSWMTRTEQQKVAQEIPQIYIELSTHCNLACKTCVRHSIENFTPHHFSKTMMRRLIAMLQDLPKLQRIVILGFGEALCNPNFIQNLTELKSCGAVIVLVSNAHFINLKIANFFVDLPLDELWLSFDDDPWNIAHIRRGISAETFAQKVSLITDARNRITSSLPKLGMEIVALRSNMQAISSIIDFGIAVGIEQFIVSNVFPYTEHMKDEIIYSVFDEPKILLGAISKSMRNTNIRYANQNADVLRSCPFIEKGTVFITAFGDIAPCPELAYTHPAWYFGSRRMHRAIRFGNISKTTLQLAWQSLEFSDFRKKFEYYEFPDCSLCHQPDMCWHRTVDTKDCYGNETPCGECLWAKGIVLCP